MGDFTIDSLVVKLLDEYDVTVDVARSDVSNIVNEWVKVAVVE